MTDLIWSFAPLKDAQRRVTATMPAEQILALVLAIANLWSQPGEDLVSLVPKTKHRKAVIDTVTRLVNHNLRRGYPVASPCLAQLVGSALRPVWKIGHPISVRHSDSTDEGLIDLEAKGFGYSSGQPRSPTHGLSG